MRFRNIERSGMSKNTIIFGAVLWTAVFGCVVLMWQSRTDVDNEAEVKAEANEQGKPAGSSEENPINPETPKSSVNISFPARTLPDFQFDECMGQKLTLEDLKGKPWVASFVFTRCASTCPMITAAVMRLHDAVKDKNQEVMFVTITVDPAFDTTEIMRTYSETFRPDRDRWKFVTGGQQEIFELVVNGFGLYVKENVGAERMPGFEVAHSNRVVLVNKSGVPVGTFVGTRDEDMVKLRRILTGADEFPEQGPQLNISTSDGTPMPFQFEVKPAKQDDAAGEDADSASGDSKGGETSSGDESSSENDTEASSDNAAAIVAVSNNGDSEGGSPSQTGATTTGDATPNTLSPAEHNALIEQKMPAWTKRLPAINASLNSLAAMLLLCGYAAIKKGNKTVHRNLMMSAFATSVVFLACYLMYHYQLGEHTGLRGKKFAGTGIAATIYPLILIPHVILATFVPILAIRVFQHAFAERWDAHKWLAKITFPIWMYVSVTGVVIYGMLYHWPWSATVPASAG